MLKEHKEHAGVYLHDEPSSYFTFKHLKYMKIHIKIQHIIRLIYL